MTDDIEDSSRFDEIYNDPRFKHGVEVGRSMGEFHAWEQADKANQVEELELWLEWNRPKSLEDWRQWEADHPIRPDWMQDRTNDDS